MSDKRHGAIAFADLAGYTALTEAHGDDGAADVADVAERFFELTVSVLRGDGRIVKTIGDAVMIVTSEAIDGLETGLEVLRVVEHDPHFPGVPSATQQADWASTLPAIAYTTTDGNVMTGRSSSTRCGRLPGMNRGGFSWNRFLGITTAKRRVSCSDGDPVDAIGPSTQGRQRVLEAVQVAGRPASGHGSVFDALPGRAQGDTLAAPENIPAREARHMADSNAGPPSQEVRGSWNAAIFVGLVLVVAILFTAYVLLWDGGG